MFSPIISTKLSGIPVFFFSEYVAPKNTFFDISHTDLGIQYIQSKSGYGENYQDLGEVHRVFLGHSNWAKFHYK